MDNQKDIKKDIEEYSGTDNKLFSLVNKDYFSYFVFKKCEKLVSAIYIISNFISHDEPIKWQFRKKGIDLLSKNLSFKPYVKDTSFLYGDIALVLFEIGALLEVSYRAGFVSEMNFEILKKEFDNLGHEIAGHMEKLNQPKEFGRDFFSVQNESYESELKNLSPRSGEVKTSFSRDVNTGLAQKVNKVETQKTRPISNSFPRAVSAQVGVVNTKAGNLAKKGLKDNYANTINLDLKNKLSKVDSDDNRSELILSLFRNNKDVGLSIKDISNNIKDCSEKTIQRELSNLVVKNVLLKEGERRWSRYTLKS